MELPRSDFGERLNEMESEAHTREIEAQRKKKVEEIKRKDAQRESVRATEREQEAQAHVAEIKERWRTKMRSTMPEREFSNWWLDNKLRILEEEARQRDAAIASGSVGVGYGAM